MEILSNLWGETWLILTTLAQALPFIVGYVLLILAIAFAWSVIKRLLTPKKDYGSLKTVTFGDESSVTSNTAASIISVVLIFVLWGVFTGSKLLPSFLHAPAPFAGTGTFEYSITTPAGETDDATVTVTVYLPDQEVDAAEVPLGEGIAKNDSIAIQSARSELFRVDRNDEMGRSEETFVTAVDGQSIAPGETVTVEFGRVTMSQKGTLNIIPRPGMQMEAIWLPSPEQVWDRLLVIADAGYQNWTLAAHLSYSLYRVLFGFLLGAIVGIPLGYAMGLSSWFRGWFDPIVEFMRPVPPLALIPLVIIWFGIGELGKIILLFLASLWIMAIAARSGVSGVRISKVHAAYSLGASKWQVMRYVIIPNSLPEIFTGARVAMGVCWGTVVAAELVAAEQGAGMMIISAYKFLNTDIVLMGIILIGVIGFGIDMLMRQTEKWLVPWKGKG